MNYDPIVTCPYDPAHRSLRSRIQCHITKCKKNHPNSGMKQCPYDARHIIDPSEYYNHIDTCPERESVLRYKIVEKDSNQPKILPIGTIAVALSEESWEDDVKIKSYDPMKHTENQAVIRMPMGASKSERKKHRREERLRHSVLEEELKVQKESATKNKINKHAPTSTQSTVPKKVSTEATQKLPHNSSKRSVMNNTATVNQNQAAAVYKNESLLQQQEKSNIKENLDIRPKTFSYAAAAKKALPTHDVVNESVKCDNEKENNPSCYNNAIETVSNNVAGLTIW